MRIDEDGLPDHFKYGPSSAYRWTKCPGSAGASGEESAEARLGTIAHSYASAALGGEKVPSEIEQSFSALPKADQDELIYHINGYVEFVRSFDFDVRLIEKKIAHPFIEDHGGTTDTLLLKGRCLHVIDLKYGLMKVDVDENPQLKCYINLGRCLYPDADEFKGTIYQPRLNSVNTVSFSREELDRFLLDDVMAATGSDELVAGDHCTFCPLLVNCDVALAYAHRTIDAFEEIETDEDRFNRLADVVSFGKAFNKILNKAKREMIGLARDGVKSDRVKVVYRLSNRSWVDQEKAAAMVLEMLGDEVVDIFTEPIPPRLKSPNQIEKILKDKLGRKINFEDEIDRKIRGYDVVPRSSKRHEIDFMDGFIDIGEEEDDFENLED